MNDHAGATVVNRRLSLKYTLLLLVMAAFMVTTTTMSVMRFLEQPGSGDFKHFYYAAYGVVNDQNIYSSGEPFTGVHWYAYLPLFAVVLSPLVWLGLGGAGAVWSVINAGLICACIYIAARESITRLGMKANPNLIVGVSFLVMLIFIDKIRSELRMGQSDAFVLIWMMLGLMWLGRRPILAGFMLGGSVNVKLQGLVFLPYLIVRGRVKNLVGFVIGTVFFAMFGAIIWGYERNMQYLSTVLGWVGGLVGVEDSAAPIESGLYPLEWERSLTIPSILKRAQLQWGLSESLVTIGTLAMIALIVAIGWGLYLRQGAALFRGRRAHHDDRSPRGRGLVSFEWAGLIVGMLIFSPQSTVRHFFLSIIVVALGSAILHTSIHWKRKIPVATLMAFYWIAITFPPGDGDYEVLSMQWRAIGGPMWTLLALYFCVLWTGLGIVRNLSDTAAMTCDDP